ncbi:thioredoxin-dependent thiol peroxidase [Coraliomargarita sp. SDUM461004]|uniref:thioredoxin-dependent peroxiredoxin n=1 Tax=Thalassobacterium sedimentorum TaxID=3041258 RepID=A0ABU1AEZ4_9BACT|nr:thioredoxin-dependent thiol peroxidase [Coraliomargarita sp. SDUM461004]MDQ8193305.1 thioredoxin-dependent thiol peroxidase [Coraliomargarita sp. SDUM461004]
MGKPTPLEAGKKAPNFQFTEDGTIRTLDELGQACLLYFYPKDDTPGCTKEACAIRDAWSEFIAAGLKVIGVSKDDDAAHTKFKDKYQLPFPLIADTDLQLSQAYGVYGEKKFMGRIYDGIHRMSFLIDANGTITKAYHKVKPDAHASEVLADLAALPE